MRADIRCLSYTAAVDTDQCFLLLPRECWVPLQVCQNTDDRRQLSVFTWLIKLHYSTACPKQCRSSKTQMNISWLSKVLKYKAKLSLSALFFIAPSIHVVRTLFPWSTYFQIYIFHVIRSYTLPRVCTELFYICRTPSVIFWMWAIKTLGEALNAAPLQRKEVCSTNNAYQEDGSHRKYCDGWKMEKKRRGGR